MKNSLLLVAVGGNALMRAGQRGTIDEQRANAALTAQALVGLIAQGHQLVITHGNGPQVGAQLLRAELSADQVTPEPLDVCVADTEGAIGYLLAHALHDALTDAHLHRPIASVITQVVVDVFDPAFELPTKPIGRFYTEDEARHQLLDHGWHMIRDEARGYRRVVPSPTPCEIVELDVIRTLVQAGTVVIAAGGGGIPVVRRNNHLVGVEAVIDKDLVGALLARLLGAERFIISTDTPQVYRNYGRPDQQPLGRIGAAEAHAYLAAGQFPAGSMGPKIEAALEFLEAGGQEVVITTPELLDDAIVGKAGTHIVPDAALTQNEECQTKAIGSG